MLSQYYDPNRYKNAELLFQKYLTQCVVQTPPLTEFKPFQVSTITSVSKIADSVNIQRFFEHLQIDNDNIIYAKYSHFLKGNKRNKKQSRHKLEANNQLFSNQMTIGFRCKCGKLAKHNHKNPISIKIFRNGGVQMTGCKDIVEIEHMYHKLHNELSKINKIERNIAKNIIPFDKKNIRIEMINGTFYANAPLDLNKVLKTFMNKYAINEVFINHIHNKKSPLHMSLPFLKEYDAFKCKDKMPSVFIHNTGAFNIITTSTEVLQKAYNFIHKNLTENWSTLVEKKIDLNTDCLETDPQFRQPPLLKLSSFTVIKH